MRSSATVSPARAGTVFSAGSRRDFLKVVAAGGVAAALPSLLTSCNVSDVTSNSQAGTGTLLQFDFGQGEVTYLRFLYCYKLLQVDLYTQMVAKFSSTNFTTAEQALVTTIRNHELVHRDTLKALVGTANDVTITPYWSSANFANRTDVLPLAMNFEDASVGMYNGIVQLLFTSNAIALVLEMVTVEARHVAALQDDYSPNTGFFAPSSQDNSYTLTAIAQAIQPFLMERLSFLNAPSGI
jgi:Ferritin-like domain/TAT (twin-arginine translocation) pathway signal sequence